MTSRTQLWWTFIWLWFDHVISFGFAIYQLPENRIRIDHHKRMDIPHTLIPLWHLINFTHCPALDIPVEYASIDCKEHKLSIDPHLSYPHNSIMLILKRAIWHPQISTYLTQTNGIHQQPVVLLMKPDAKLKLINMDEIYHRITISL